MLLFPLTLTLLAIDLILQSQHHFTVITLPPPKEELVQTSAGIAVQGDAKRPSAAVITIEQAEVVTLPLRQQEPVQELVLAVPPRESLQPVPPVAAVTAQVVEVVRQQVITPPRPVEPPFQSFTIQISEKTLPAIASFEQLRLKARQLGQEVSDRHIQLRLDIPFYNLNQAEVKQFLEELATVANVVTTRWRGLFLIVPKKNEAMQNGLLIRTYENGVIEEVQSFRNSSRDDWDGRRLYPNGTTETGWFESFRLKRGTRVEKGITTYRLPDKLLISYKPELGFMYIDVEGEKRLAVIRKKPGSSSSSFDYVQVDEELIPTLVKLLETESDVRKDPLREILSGPINCEQFIKFLFETNSIFSVKPYPLQILLAILQEKKLAINLCQEHPQTKQTLLECHSNDAELLEALLSADPKLIQRTKGAEIPLVRALLSGNKEGATLLLAAMKKQNIELFPRELLFVKIVFSEGQVSLKELQTLSPEDQEIVYHLANIYAQLNVVQMMTKLGFGRREAVLMHEGPSILGCNMDAQEMHESMLSFLTNLRSQKLLLTQSEFAELPSKNYIEKGSDIGRILGRDYLERKARELGLKQVKVPKKMIVIADNADLQLRTNQHLSMGVSSDNVTVYAERVKAAGRQITPEETAELLRLFEATGYSDIHWGNVIIAEDGVYIIDTKFTNFWLPYYLKNGRQYAEMAKIVYMLPIEQQKVLIAELNRKMETYRKQEEELNSQRTLRLQVEQTSLQKTGCFYGPTFTFPAKQILGLASESTSHMGLESLNRSKGDTKTESKRSS